MGAPLLLTKTCAESAADSYAEEKGIRHGAILGGESLIADHSGAIIFGDEPAMGHNYTSTVFAATCTEDGYTHYECICGKNYNDSYVPSTGHAWGEWIAEEEATDENDGKEHRSCI